MQLNNETKNLSNTEWGSMVRVSPLLAFDWWNQPAIKHHSERNSFTKFVAFLLMNNNQVGNANGTHVLAFVCESVVCVFTLSGTINVENGVIN